MSATKTIAVLAGLGTAVMLSPPVVLFRWDGPTFGEPLPTWAACAIGALVFAVLVALFRPRGGRDDDTLDVRDLGGRLARLGVALLIAAIAGGVTFVITIHSHHNRVGWGVWTFTPIVSMLVSVATFALVLVAETWLAKRPRRADLPPARLVAR